MQINYQTTAGLKLHINKNPSRHEETKLIDLEAEVKESSTRSRCGAIWIEYNEMESMNLQWRNLQAFKMFSFLSAEQQQQLKLKLIRSADKVSAIFDQQPASQIATSRVSLSKERKNC